MLIRYANAASCYAETTNDFGNENMNDATIYLADIEPLNNALGTIHKIKNVQQSSPLMSGEFRYQAFAKGLSMHASNVQELQDGDNVLQLPAGISFNIIFSGEVEFSFGNHRYKMENRGESNRATVTAIVNPDTEILTRHMKKDGRVEKLNIFVEKNWLEQRARTDEESKKLQEWFADREVLSWPANTELLNACFSLLENRKVATIVNRLTIEQKTIETLSECLFGLLKHQKLAKAHRKTRSTDRNPKDKIALNTDLKTEINKAIPQCKTISELATAVNMSTRTLQRKFKLLYRLSASEYIKQQRLELAKKALIIDSKSIGEASFEAGYTYPSNFVSAFKKNYGITPAEYKKRHA